MNLIKIAIIAGGIMILIGLVGLFVGKISQNDGALVIAGSLIFGAGIISQTILNKK